MFVDRKDAAKLLCKKVEQCLAAHGKFAGATDIVVAALPRGGVPIALEIARHLGCRIDVLSAKKIPMPGSPECAIGATSADGITVLSPEIPKTKQWNDYLNEQVKTLQEKTRKTEAELYHKAGYASSNYQNKVVLIVDDGIATGMTAFAAVLAARQRGAAYIVVVAPVISPESFKELRDMCDEVIAIMVPPEFHAVGRFYRVFDQVSDEQVIEDMRQSRDFIGRPSPIKAQLMPADYLNPGAQLEPGQMMDDYQ